MSVDPTTLEKEAYAFLSQEKYEEAFGLFRRAGAIYKSKGDHKQAALCFASAGSSWSKKSGENTFYNAALSYTQAARQAQKSGDFEYAALLYKHAAISHEKDGEFLNFSDCFYRSKESYRRFLGMRLRAPAKIFLDHKLNKLIALKILFESLFWWFVLSFSFIIWGHGERPSRTFLFGSVTVFLSAFFYNLGYLVRGLSVFKPDFYESLYFSVVTFTTLGYGDITPFGLTKFIAAFEAFSGLFIMPLFIIALSRKYLRV